MHKWDIFISDTLYRVSFQLNQALTFTCTHNNPTLDVITRWMEVWSKTWGTQLIILLGKGIPCIRAQSIKGFVRANGTSNPLPCLDLPSNIKNGCIGTWDGRSKRTLIYHNFHRLTVTCLNWKGSIWVLTVFSAAEKRLEFRSFTNFSNKRGFDLCSFILPHH